MVFMEQEENNTPLEIPSVNGRRVEAITDWVGNRIVNENKYNLTTYSNLFILKRLDLFLLNKQKILFYLNEKKKIKFKLLLKPEYQFEGMIENENKAWEEEADSFILVADNGSRMLFDYSEIDSSTILPTDIDPYDYLYNSEPIKEEDRKSLMEKYKNHCAYNLEGCEIKATEIDHIIPRVLGGSSHVSNLAPACSNCNKKKGKKLMRPKPPENEPHPTTKDRA